MTLIFWIACHEGHSRGVVIESRELRYFDISWPGHTEPRTHTSRFVSNAGAVAQNSRGVRTPLIRNMVHYIEAIWTLDSLSQLLLTQWFLHLKSIE